MRLFMTAFTILLGGELSITDRVFRQTSDTRVIAADSGMRHAASLGVVPELWVGDFDSASPRLVSQWSNVEKQPFPRSKAATDGEIAVEAAIARGATSLVFAGALGGERTDHAVMHLLIALALAERGLPTLLTSGDEEGKALLAGKAELDLPKGALFSILPFSALTGLTIENARYPLEETSVPHGSSLTISNVAEGPVRIHLKSGRAILLARPFDKTGA
jgi:thiamine pyrophosphokinase